MRKVLVIILTLFSCNEVKILPFTKLQNKKTEDTLTMSEQQGIKQIKFLDSLHKIGKF